jgi:hypothetical protein
MTEEEWAILCLMDIQHKIAQTGSMTDSMFFWQKDEISIH